MAETPRRYFEDRARDAVLADYTAVVTKMRRAHAEGRCSFEDLITTLAAARLLAVRMLSPDLPSLPVALSDPSSRLSASR